jgi:flagellar protein FlgJ
MRSLETLGAPGADWNPVGIAGGSGAAAPQGGGFGALYGQLQAEVRQFIEQGSPGMAAAPALSPEGQWQRMNQGAAAADADAATPADQEAFAARMMPQAQDAAAQLGVAPEVLVAQAALETGWGRQTARRSDGGDSHNLFGIKAGAAWSGDVAPAETTEYAAGRPHVEAAAFRAYASPAQSFEDLAQLVGGSARYRAALGTGGDAHAYAAALQRGGYATDPAYADKMAGVARRLQALHPKEGQP